MNSNNLSPKIQGIIFDLDNLLIDSEKHWPTIDERYFTGLLGQEAWKVWQPKWLERKKAGIQLYDIMKELTQEFGLSREPGDIIADRMAGMISFYRGNLQPMPGANEIIKKLKASGLNLAIASGMHPDIIKEVAKMMGWDKLISAWASTHEVPKHKPDPAVFLLVAERLGLEAEQCLVFENEIIGVQAAKRAKMLCVAVPDRAREIDGITRLADAAAGSLNPVEIEPILSKFL